MKKNLCIIPIYNEAQIIQESTRLLVQFFCEQNQSQTSEWTVVIADNGSTDNAVRFTEELEGMSNQCVRVVYHVLNERGRGSALRTIVSRYDADYYYYIDADIPLELADFSTLIATLETGNHDIIVGRRGGTRPLLRKFLTRALRFGINVLFDVSFSDVQCGVKGFTNRAVGIFTTCNERGYFLDTEFLVRAVREHLRVREIPIQWIEARYPNRKSKIDNVRESWRAVCALVRIARRQCPRGARSIIFIGMTGCALFAALLWGRSVFAGLGFHTADQTVDFFPMLLIQNTFFVLVIAMLYGLARVIKQFPPKLFLAVIFIFFGLFAAVTITTLPTRSTDLYWNLLLAKGFVRDGFNPYVTTPFDLRYDSWYEAVPTWRDTSMTHGPLWIFFLAPAVYANESLWFAVLAAKLLLVTVFCIALFGVWRICEALQCSPEKRVFIFLFLLWNPFILQSVFIDGHNDVIVMALVVFGVFACIKKRYTASALLFFLAGGIKYIPGLLAVIPYVQLMRDSFPSFRIMFYKTSALIVAGVSLVVALFAPFVSPGMFSGVGAQAVLWNPNFTLPGTVFLHEVAGLNGFMVLFVGVVLLIGVAVWFSWRRSTLTAAALAVSVFLFFGMQWFQPWYILWIFPLLLFILPFGFIALLSVFLLAINDILPAIYASVVLVAVPPAFLLSRKFNKRKRTKFLFNG